MTPGPRALGKTNTKTPFLCQLPDLTHDTSCPNGPRDHVFALPRCFSYTLGLHSAAGAADKAHGISIHFIDEGTKAESEHIFLEDFTRQVR